MGLVTPIATGVGSWQQTSTFVVAPSGTVTSRVLLYSTSTAVTTAWWDDFALRESTLPAGIRLNSTAGVLTGTPTQIANTDALIAARDSTGATVRMRVHLNVSR